MLMLETRNPALARLSRLKVAEYDKSDFGDHHFMSTRQRVKRSLKPWLYGALSVRYRLPHTSGSEVLLSFDDGPDPEITPAVLERLAHYEARAIFFIVGCRISRAPHLLEQIESHGHIIGNHTHEHRARYSFGEYKRDLIQSQELIASLTGTKPTFFRPPAGRLAPACLWTARQLGLRTVLWSVDTSDWSLKCQRDAEKRGDEVAQRIRPRDIVLLHDDNKHVLTVLDKLLPQLCARQIGLARGVEVITEPRRADEHRNNHD
jgi:peptidoglycan-N-acetylglucosamine deacetylase